MVRTTFSCANATCDNRTRDLRRGRWQKRPDLYPDAKVETKFTTHICFTCYKDSLQARHEAGSRRTTRTSPDAALQAVRPWTARASEVEQLAACDSLSSSGEEEGEFEMELMVENEEETGIPMVISAEAEDADEQVDIEGNEEAAETGAGLDTLDEYIKRYEEQHGLLKPPRQQGAVFLRENSGAGPAALKCVRELLRKVWLLERKTKPFLDAALALEQSELPPLLSHFSAAILAGSVAADHAVWSELGDTFQNM